MVLQSAPIPMIASLPSGTVSLFPPAANPACALGVGFLCLSYIALWGRLRQES